MIELADDIDVSVAVCSIGLVKQLLRHQLLPDDDLGPLYDLLIDDPADIRRAIGELVYDHLMLKSNDNGSSEVHLSRMLQILREFSTDPILCIYVIDDVWEYMKAMKDWKCIISMLLDENPMVELTDDDATNWLSHNLFALAFCHNLIAVAHPDETEDEDSNKEYIEETNRDAVMIAAAKLVATDTVSKESLAPEIISHFVMHGTSVAEIVKHLITVLKKKDDISNIFLEALKRAHYWHLEELSRSNGGAFTGKSFQECKDLAARLSGTFMGAARNKHREDILKIVKEGIEYAFIDAPKQLSFLESAVLHFVSKLPTPDVLEVLKDVQSRTVNINTDEDPSGWRPYNSFVESLREKYAKNEGLLDEKDGTAVRRRGRPRKRQNIEGKRLFNEHSSSEEEDSISGSDHEDAQEEEKQDEEEEEEAPLIHSLRSSKLRSLKVSKDARAGVSASKTSEGASN
ncbi:hypothetical protein GH714_037231 [Hevea brasiliensis]|uniref:Cohesin subunit SCC3/SA HEAT-repeats domain-containing protein n=1 Tax=Hevea brasiliensis TaxID=3981 RepID=A0A6A6MMF6_HEVBR|nr:hypothetical protein GH714_037231 [Hevea brasiliensis]